MTTPCNRCLNDYRQDAIAALNAIFESRETITNHSGEFILIRARFDPSAGLVL